MERALERFFEGKAQAADEGRLVDFVLDAGPSFALLLTPDTPPETTQRLIEVYWREVIPATAGAQRLRAVNDCGVLLLRAGRNHEALKMYDDLETETRRALEQADAASAAQFLVNAGVAHERGGQAKAALSSFLAALERDPSSDEARLGLERRTAEVSLGEAARVWTTAAKWLRQGRQLHEAEQALERALRSAAEADLVDDALPLLPELVRYLDEVTVEPQAVLERWRSGLQRLAAAGDEFVTAALAADLLLALERPEQIPFEGGGSWYSAHSGLFARLLLRLAQGLERDDPTAAAALYDLARRLDPESFEAAIYLANVLGNESARIDPEGRRLEQLVRELFEAKGQAYAAGDQEGIARLHSVLGTIYERQGRWGSPNEVQSAVFQWRGALQAQERLARQRVPQAEQPPRLSPVLHSHLARAYEEADRTRWSEEAFRQYSLAAEGYLELQQPQAADVMVDHARRARPVLDETESDRLRVLTSRVDEALRDAATRRPGGGENSDLEIRDEIYQRLLADPEVRRTWESFEVRVTEGEAVVQGVAAAEAPPATRQDALVDVVEDHLKGVRGIKKIEVETGPPR